MNYLPTRLVHIFLQGNNNKSHMKKEMKRINVVWLDDMYPIFIV